MVQYSTKILASEEKPAQRTLCAVQESLMQQSEDFVCSAQTAHSPKTLGVAVQGLCVKCKDPGPCSRS